MEQFTRHETIVLTRTSPGRLAYLARTGVVVPTLNQADPAHHPIYSWEQILELRAIQNLRRQVSLQTIRKILTFLQGNSGDRCLHNKQLLVDDGTVDWVMTTPEAQPQIVRVADRGDRNVGQLELMISPSRNDLAYEVWETARRSNVIDFESFRQRTSEHFPPKC
ncbi:MAG: MerR family transcriptional regulator [Cyanobacteria bacterium J06638_28]